MCLYRFILLLPRAMTRLLQPLALQLALCLCLSVSLPFAQAQGCGSEVHAADASAGGMCTGPPEIADYLAPESVDAAHAADATPAASETESASTADPTAWVSRSTTLDRIRARGYLVCAHVDFTLGHSRVQSRTEATGMEPELCKGLSAALGLDPAVSPQYHVMRAPSERFPLLQAGDVDVVFALTSKTVGRDLLEQGSFSVPYFHDQHNLMYRSDAGLSSAADLAGKTVCATLGTTNPNVLGDYIAALEGAGVVPKGSVTVRLLDDEAEALRLLGTGECPAFINDHSVVAGYVHSEKCPTEGVEYVLASWPGTPFARAPFSAVSLDGDVEFASIVDWFVQGLFLAEMYGVDSENVDEKFADPSLPGEAQRVLGAQLLGGKRLPFDMRRAVKSIGNYAQLYERNFGYFLPRTRANKLFQDGGAVFPGGFR